jgi:hypothetical protein
MAILCFPIAIQDYGVGKQKTKRSIHLVHFARFDAYEKEAKRKKGFKGY